MDEETNKPVPSGPLVRGPQLELAFRAPHEQRVIDEKTELDLKINSLGNFIGTAVWSALPFEDRDLLHHQFEVMVTYSAVLAKRIARFA